MWQGPMLRFAHFNSPTATAGLTPANCDDDCTYSGKIMTFFHSFILFVYLVLWCSWFKPSLMEETTQYEPITKLIRNPAWYLEPAHDRKGSEKERGLKLICPRIDGWDYLKCEQPLSFFSISYLFGHFFKVGTFKKKTQHCQNCCHCTKWQQWGGMLGLRSGVRWSRVVW